VRRLASVACERLSSLADGVQHRTGAGHGGSGENADVTLMQACGVRYAADEDGMPLLHDAGEGRHGIERWAYATQEERERFVLDNPNPTSVPELHDAGSRSNSI
jgi:hypothetical protein